MYIYPSPDLLLAFFLFLNSAAPAAWLWLDDPAVLEEGVSSAPELPGMGRVRAVVGRWFVGGAVGVVEVPEEGRALWSKE